MSTAATSANPARLMYLEGPRRIAHHHAVPQEGSGSAAAPFAGHIVGEAAVFEKPGKSSTTENSRVSRKKTIRDSHLCGFAPNSSATEPLVRIQPDKWRVRPCESGSVTERESHQRCVICHVNAANGPV